MVHRSCRFLIIDSIREGFAPLPIMEIIMAYEIDVYLGQIPDADIEVAVGDVPGLQITAYDADGNPWEDGYDAYLVVRRCLGDSSGEWVIPELLETTEGGDNIYHFNLDDITHERGDYDAYLVLDGEWDDAFVTPLVTSYSFESFPIKVRE